MSTQRNTFSANRSTIVLICQYLNYFPKSTEYFNMRTTIFRYHLQSIMSMLDTQLFLQPHNVPHRERQKNICAASNAEIHTTAMLVPLTIGN
jgi:hypothetical protein